jgi:D-alanine-D-alanine ligase
MKKTIAVIFGGTNTEHEVSIVSARSVIENLNPELFNVFPIYITKANQWAKLMPQQAALLPTAVEATVVPTDLPKQTVDVIFPILHGPYGEDGTIQGMIKMLHLPFVGNDVLSSAVCMDKVVQKQLCLQQGLPVAPFAFATRHEWQTGREKIMAMIRAQLNYPLFVKPANQGSSVGISKVTTEAELDQAVAQALAYDTKVIIEQGVANVREIECAVLGNHEPETSVLGEIIASNEFYDYDAKYVDGQSEAIIPAQLPEPVAEKVKSIALKAFKILNCSGLARIDFLVDAKSFNVYLNELNTMPGFTSISMYPKLWQASGLSYSRLLEKLIELAIERHTDDEARQMTYTPKLPWHQS